MENNQFEGVNQAPEQPVQQAPVQQPVQQAPVQQSVQQPVYQQPVQQPVYQQPVQQPVYQQPVQQPVYQVPVQPVYQDPTSQVMTVGQYIGTFILSAIPIVNIICWIVWLVSPNTNRNKKNFLIAIIVMEIICFVLCGIVGAIVTATGVGAMYY